MMSDPRTYTIPTEQDIDCEFCGWTNTATDWTDIRTGAWDYTFECASCGRRNADHGNALDRGAVQPLFSLLAVGWALITIGLLGHSAWSWPLILGGVWLLAAVYIIRFFMGAKQPQQQEGNTDV